MYVHPQCIYHKVFYVILCVQFQNINNRVNYILHDIKIKYSKCLPESMLHFWRIIKLLLSEECCLYFKATWKTTLQIPKRTGYFSYRYNLNLYFRLGLNLSEVIFNLLLYLCFVLLGLDLSRWRLEYFFL